MHNKSYMVNPVGNEKSIDDLFKLAIDEQKLINTLCLLTADVKENPQQDVEQLLLMHFPGVNHKPRNITKSYRTWSYRGITIHEKY